METPAPTSTATVPVAPATPTLNLGQIIAAQVGDGIDPTVPVAAPPAPAAPASPVAPAPAPAPAPVEPEVVEGADNPDAVRNALQTERLAAREARTELREVSERLQEAQDAVAALTERATTAESEVARLTPLVDRYEVAADTGMDLRLAARLNGATRDELAADAAVLVTQFGNGTPARPLDFDAGPRKTAPQPKADPETAHGRFLTDLLGGQS